MTATGRGSGARRPPLARPGRRSRRWWCWAWWRCASWQRWRAAANAPASEGSAPDTSAVPPGTRSVQLVFVSADALSMITEQRQLPASNRLEEELRAVVEALCAGPETRGAIGPIPRGRASAGGLLRRAPGGGADRLQPRAARQPPRRLGRRARHRRRHPAHDRAQLPGGARLHAARGGRAGRDAGRATWRSTARFDPRRWR